MNRLTKTLFLVAVLTLLLPGLASAAKTPKFRFRAVTVDNSVETKIFGINEDGKIVGTFATAADQKNFVEHGFIRSGSGRIKKPIDAPASFDTDLGGINDEGEIVGTFATSDGMGGRGYDRCFILEEGAFEVFDVALPNAGAPDCNGINNHGSTVGDFYDSTFGPFGANHGWLRTEDGTFTQLDFPGALSTEAYGINNKGHIVGLYEDTNGEHGFLLKDGTYTPIDVPGSIDTNAFGINDRDEIVGSYTTDPFTDHGFLLKRDGTTFVTVDVTLPNMETNGVRGITEEGVMIGIYTDQNGNNQGFIARRGDD